MNQLLTGNITETTTTDLQRHAVPAILEWITFDETGTTAANLTTSCFGATLSFRPGTCLADLHGERASGADQLSALLNWCGLVLNGVMASPDPLLDWYTSFASLRTDTRAIVIAGTIDAGMGCLELSDGVTAELFDIKASGINLQDALSNWFTKATATLCERYGPVGEAA